MNTPLSATPPCIGIVSLGCAKAGSDSERILTRLRAEGYELTMDSHDADLVIINTCGFIQAAEEESLSAIGEALEENGKVIVTGCLGAKGDVVRKTFPQVLAVTGPAATDEVLRLVHEHAPKPHEPFLDLLPPEGVRLTPAHYAWLKISEGCSHDCTFCIIPNLRGALQSRSVNDVLSEAQNLAEAGVKELLVVAQDTAAYGLDVRYRTGFWGTKPVKTRIKELCEELARMEMWIRLHYVYPYPAVDELVHLMAEGKILPYLDIPLQHASPAILKAMRRPAHMENMLQRIDRWRQECPDLTLRSTFITGFPGESEADFDTLVSFLEQAQFDRVGAFTYSDVAGAKANDLPNAVPEEVREDRRRWLMSVQEDISAAKLAKKIGQTMTVLVDEVDEQGTMARSAADAPEVDGLVFIDDYFSAQPGDFLTVTVTDADHHDLYARCDSPNP